MPVQKGVVEFKTGHFPLQISHSKKLEFSYRHTDYSETKRFRSGTETSSGSVAKTRLQQIQRCHLLDHADLILIRDPHTVREPLFNNVIYVDLLHWLLNTCDYGFEALLGVMSDAIKVECDLIASQLPVFCDPEGVTIRRFDQVTSVTYLTTARRLTLMFYWAHVLGTQALMLPVPCRRPALVAISSIQNIILATHGRREYSVNEWERLVVASAMEYFSALQSLLQYREDHDDRPSARPFTPFPK